MPAIVSFDVVPPICNQYPPYISLDSILNSKPIVRQSRSRDKDVDNDSSWNKIEVAAVCAGVKNKAVVVVVVDAWITPIVMKTFILYSGKSPTGVLDFICYFGDSPAVGLLLFRA